MAVNVTEFATLATAEDSPAGVTTVMTRFPAVAAASIVIETVASVPLEFTTGGLAMVTPVLGVMRISEALCRLVPFSVSFNAVAGIGNTMGSTEVMFANGRITLNIDAFAMLNGSAVVPASTLSERAPNGAVASTTTSTVKDFPSAATTGVPMVKPVLGLNLTSVTFCNSLPVKVSVTVSPIAPEDGDTSFTVAPFVMPIVGVVRP